MGTREQRLVLASRCLTAGGVFLFAAAAFHFIAAPHLPAILKGMLDSHAYAFLAPVVSFTFGLNGVLLLPCRSARSTARKASGGASVGRRGSASSTR